jgi:type II secretory pathway predicted ATPase ExeA
MTSPGHTYRARQRPTKMLQSVACLVGAGKTASVRTAIAALDATRHTVIYLPNPQVGVRGIHEAIITAFGANPANLSSRLITQATGALAAERDERGRTPVLVLDEAHLLSYDQLETIRMLTNHGMDADSPLACLLIGQPPCAGR